MTSFQAEKAAAHRNKVSNQKLFSSMTKVYQVNRKHDHKLEVELEDIRKTEHMESVRRYSDVRRLQRTLSDMRLEKNRLRLTFTPEQIRDGNAAPVLSWRKIQTHRLQNQPRSERRAKRSEGTNALMAVAENVEFSAKNQFKSAIMAVCLSKAMTRIAEEGSDRDSNADNNTENEDTPSRAKGKADKQAEIHEKVNANDKKQNSVDDPEQVRKLDLEKEESKRLSVVDIIRSRVTNESRAHGMDADRKSISLPTFGQLHQSPRRRSSRQQDQGRRPSTVNPAEFAKKRLSSSSVMDEEGDARRMRNACSGVERDDDDGRQAGSKTTERRLSRSRHSNNLWQGSAPDSNIQLEVTSFQRKKRNELARQSEDTMRRIKQFLNSSLPK